MYYNNNNNNNNNNNYNLYDHVASLVLNAAYNELSVAYNVLRSLRS